MLVQIGKQIIHRFAIGMTDIKGDDFADMFAYSIDGDHLSSPLGVADVVCGDCAWSVKTVKAGTPFDTTQVRLISGRNSPDYSHGIANPRDDIQKTGKAVLTIWNERVNEALKEHNDLRIVVLIRNVIERQFVLFEEEAQRFVPDTFEWSYTQSKNLKGQDKHSGAHHFTWQPHGAQFTIIRRVPVTSRRFAIPCKIPIIPSDKILNTIGFQTNWIAIVL